MTVKSAIVRPVFWTPGLEFGVFTTADDAHSTSPSSSPRRRVTGIADVPLIGCQSGSMSDSTTSSLENVHLSSIDGTSNPAYHSSPSDSDRSTSQERDGETDSVSERSSRRLSRSPGVSFTRKKPVTHLQSGIQNQDIHSGSRMDASADGAGNDVDPVSTSDVIEFGKSYLDSQQSSEDMRNECDFESNDSTFRQHTGTSMSIGAKLVVTSPALNQQNSVRVPAPLPHTCTSVVSNTTASSYSDSELIPQRNSVSHNVTKMVATEHVIRRQRPRVPQVYPLPSRDMSGERFASSVKQKPLTSEQLRQNRVAIQKQLHLWHFQRSLSAGDNPASRRPLPDDASVRGLGTRTGMQSRHVNHTFSSPTAVPVLGSADVAGVSADSLLSLSYSLHSSDVSGFSPDSAVNHSSSVVTTADVTDPENSTSEIMNTQMSAGSADVAGVTADSLLLSSSSLYPSTVSSVNPSSAENHFSTITATDNTKIPQNFSTEVADMQMSATEDSKLENKQADDGVFEEEDVNSQESRSSAIINILQTQNSDESVSTSDQSVSTSSNSSSEHRTGDGVPNRAILRRGSGE